MPLSCLIFVKFPVKNTIFTRNLTKIRHLRGKNFASIFQNFKNNSLMFPSFECESYAIGFCLDIHSKDCKVTTIILAEYKLFLT